MYLVGSTRCQLQAGTGATFRFCSCIFSSGSPPSLGTKVQLRAAVFPPPNLELPSIHALAHNITMTIISFFPLL